MSKTFEYRRRVEFCETDAAGIVHFSSFFLYMEQAEHAFWRHLGLSVFRQATGDLLVSWPRVSVSCQYRGPVGFEDEVDLQLSIARLGEKSITFKFSMRVKGRHVADGETTAVCCRVHDSHSLESVKIPEEFRAKLAAYLP